MFDIILLVITLVVIVVSSNIFCNALEHLSERLEISEGVTGSIFAAVGTALPETLIAILAILGISGSGASHDVGMGAILGAPLMLATLSFFVMALSVLFQRGLFGKIEPEYIGAKRDITAFMVAFILAIVGMFSYLLPYGKYLSFIIAGLLMLNYLVYLLKTIKDSKGLVENGHGTQSSAKLLISKLGMKDTLLSVIIQLIAATLFLIYIAQLFINTVSHVATVYNISAFLLSLVIIPIATELPEKINSILWIRAGKDTLAIGNITGSLVFQMSLLPTVAMLCNGWNLDQVNYLVSIIITLLASGWLYINISKNKLYVWHFIVNGLLYAVSIATLLLLHFHGV